MFKSSHQNWCKIKHSVKRLKCSRRKEAYQEPAGFMGEIHMLIVNIANIAHPVLLPKNSCMSVAIIRWCHKNVAHGGRGLTLNELRLWFLDCHSLVVKVLDSQSRSPVFKTTGWLQGRLSLHPSEVDKMSTRNFWELNGKK